MKDHALYQYLLGLESPWTVKSVALDIQQQKVDVRAEHPQNSSWPCPKCGCHLPVYDHSPERTWRHLDSCQFKTYLHASIPRVNCQEHGVSQVDVPWAKPHSRFTLLFERLAIDVLKQCTINCYEPFIKVTEHYIGSEKIVIDRFHSKNLYAGEKGRHKKDALGNRSALRTSMDLIF